jgi:saccharopine dehydrogenase-like NADP-dependent oxidoreductase
MVAHKTEKGKRWARLIRGTTGVMQSIVAQMMANGTITKRGVFTPGQVLDPKLVLQELKKRGHKGILVTTMLTQKM